VPFVTNRPYPEQGGNLTAYVSANTNPARDWCEMEQVGPLQTVEPGGSISITETFVITSP